MAADPILRPAPTVAAHLQRLVDWLTAHPDTRVGRSAIGGNLVVYADADYLGHVDPLIGDFQLDEEVPS